MTNEARNLKETQLWLEKWMERMNHQLEVNPDQSNPVLLEGVLDETLDDGHQLSIPRDLLEYFRGEGVGLKFRLSLTWTDAS